MSHDEDQLIPNLYRWVMAIIINMFIILILKKDLKIYLHNAPKTFLNGEYSVVL
jgi:hypothetical protein